MKREEIDILGIKKSKEGKDFTQIKTEINNLNTFQRDLKLDKKTIILQEKQIQKQQIEINKLKKKIMQLELSQSQGDTQGQKKVGIGELNKILAICEEKVPRQEVKALCQLQNGELNCIVSFLKRNNLIKEQITNGIYYYERC